MIHGRRKKLQTLLTAALICAQLGTAACTRITGQSSASASEIPETTGDTPDTAGVTPQTAINTPVQASSYSASAPAGTNSNYDSEDIEATNNRNRYNRNVPESDKKDSTVFSDAASSKYDPGDTAAIHAMIDNNHLNAAKDDPSSWGKFVTWDGGFPKRIYKLDLSGLGLTGQLDLSGLSGAALTSLNCSNNQLTGLTGLSRLSGLKRLYCAHNQIQTLDLSSLPALSILSCHHNQLQALDLTGPTALTELNCAGNQLGTLDLSALTALTSLDCTANPLTSLTGLSRLSSLQKLDCSSGRLQTLDVSGLVSLATLNCHKNQLTQLTGFSGLSHLKNLYCDTNQLNTLDLSGLTALAELDCSSNQLNALDLSGLAALSKLACRDNPLTSFKTDAQELTVNAGAGGTAVISYVSLESNQAELTAMPDYGYSFKSWKGLPGGVSNTPAPQIPLTGSLDVTAVFDTFSKTAQSPQ